MIFKKSIRKLIKNKNYKTINTSGYSGKNELFNNEQGLIGYTEEIANKIIHYLENLNQDNLQILDFGAGTGFLANFITNNSDFKINCVEIDEDLVKIIQAKNLTCKKYISEYSQKFDAIYSSNVLEHIDNDLEVLLEFYKHLSTGGVIFIHVPANPILFSEMDHSVGHYRRYQRNELIEKVTNAGFKIKACEYDDCLGFFASLALKFIGWNNKVQIGSPFFLKIYDLIIYPISRKLDNIGLKKIFGKNLILYATK